MFMLMILLGVCGLKIGTRHMAWSWELGVLDNVAGLAKLDTS